MSNDYEFVRDFLLAVEREATDPATALTKEKLGFAEIPDGIYYRQIIHLQRAELIFTQALPVDGIQRHLPSGLTGAGRHLLAQIRDEQVWQRIMSIQTGEMATFSLSVLMALAERVTQLNHKNSN